jgi:hypothetical protein
MARRDMRRSYRQARQPAGGVKAEGIPDHLQGLGRIGAGDEQAHRCVFGRRHARGEVACHLRRTGDPGHVAEHGIAQRAGGADHQVLVAAAEGVTGRLQAQVGVVWRRLRGGAAAEQHTERGGGEMAGEAANACHGNGHRRRWVSDKLIVVSCSCDLETA